MMLSALAKGCPAQTFLLHGCLMCTELQGKDLGNAVDSHEKIDDGDGGGDWTPHASGMWTRARRVLTRIASRKRLQKKRASHDMRMSMKRCRHEKKTGSETKRETEKMVGVQAVQEAFSPCFARRTKVASRKSQRREAECGERGSAGER